MEATFGPDEDPPPAHNLTGDLGRSLVATRMLPRF
jgi:hypothetical protein